MKTTLDLPDDLVQQVKLTAVHQRRKLRDTVADLLRKGLAVGENGPAHARSASTLLQRRRQLTKKFLSGEWGVELADHQHAERKDRTSAVRRARAWRR